MKELSLNPIHVDIETKINSPSYRKKCAPDKSTMSALLISTLMKAKVITTLGSFVRN